MNVGILSVHTLICATYARTAEPASLRWVRGARLLGLSHGAGCVRQRPAAGADPRERRQRSAGQRAPNRALDAGQFYGGNSEDFRRLVRVSASVLTRVCLAVVCGLVWLAP